MLFASNLIYAKKKAKRLLAKSVRMFRKSSYIFFSDYKYNYNDDIKFAFFVNKNMYESNNTYMSLKIQNRKKKDQIFLLMIFFQTKLFRANQKQIKPLKKEYECLYFIFW